MNRNVLALTVLVAIASFVPTAQAGFLCEDDDGEIEICLKRIPYTSFVPRSIPSVPSYVEVDKRKDDVEVVVPRSVPKAADADVKIVESPVPVRVPQIARVCKKYFPNLGEMLPIPCDD